MEVTGVVVKVTESNIVLLTDSGAFKNVPRPVSEFPLIGQPYTYKVRKKGRPYFFKFGTIAAALFLLVVTSFMFPFDGSSEEAFIVNIDINPSIELATDENLHVIRAEGLNADGQSILHSLQLEDELYDVMEQIIAETVEKGFIAKQEEPLIATSVVALREGTEERLPHLEEEIALSLKGNDAIAETELVITSEKKELYEAAKESNLSVNYYKEYKVLEAQGIVKNQEEIKGKTLAALKKMEKQQKKEERKIEKEQLKYENNGKSLHDDKPASNRSNSGNKNIPSQSPKEENQGKQAEHKSNNREKDSKQSHETKKNNQGNKPENPTENKGKEQGNKKENAPNIEQGNIRTPQERGNNPNR